jgi:hypothetical protein
VREKFSEVFVDKIYTMIMEMREIMVEGDG